MLRILWGLVVATSLLGLAPAAAEAHRFRERDAARLVKRQANKIRVQQPPILPTTTRLDTEVTYAGCIRQDHSKRHARRFNCIYDFYIGEYGKDEWGDEGLMTQRTCGSPHFRKATKSFRYGVHVRVRRGRLALTRFPIKCPAPDRFWQKYYARFYSHSEPTSVKVIPAESKPPAPDGRLSAPPVGAPGSAPLGPLRVDKTGVAATSSSLARSAQAGTIFYGADVFRGCTGWMQYPRDLRYWVFNCTWEPASTLDSLGFGVSYGIFNHSVYSEWYYWSANDIYGRAIGTFYWGGWITG